MKLKFIASLILLSYISIFGQIVNIAHRGGAGLAPENTLAAFKNAASLKANYFELDVQLSKDDSLMIMHDGTINRTTSGTGTLSVMTYEQLRAVDAGSWYNASFAGEKIPTLSEALQVAVSDPNKIGIIIEIKATTSGIVQKVLDKVKLYKMENRVVISSFTFSQIQESKTIAPAIPVQLFVSANSNTTIDQLAAINAEWIGSSVSPTKTFIDYSHSKNVKFNLWTINTASQMKTAITAGADAITTDNPNILIAIQDQTPPSDVILNSAEATETKVTLKWQAATDAESGISGYEIYRDVNPSASTLIAKVGNVTEFTDETLLETQAFYYRIKAINGASLLSANFSNEVTVTTKADATKPTVVYVNSKNEETKIVVVFSEIVDKTTSETKTYYTLNKGATVASAVLGLDQKSVILTTSALEDTSYTLTVKSVKDKAKTPNTMVTQSIIFIHRKNDNSTIAYYNMDEISKDTVLVDYTANKNDGILKNGPVLGAGVLGNGLVFDGVDDYVQYAASTSFDINAPAVTVSVWAKLNYLPADLPGAYGPLFDSDADQYVLYEDRANNELRFKVTTVTTAERPGIPAAELKTGEWLHIVGVYDGSKAIIYLNGVVKDYHSISGNVKSGQVAYLGRSGNLSASYFKGSMDNIQVFSKALTTAEVQALYKSVKCDPIDPKPSDVNIYYTLVENPFIRLKWNPVINYESNIMGYEIYRDTKPEPTTLFATVGNVTEFLDKNTVENTTHYYRIKAKNTAGLLSANYSNEVNAPTSVDKYKPFVHAVTSSGEDTKVVVEFNEKVDKTTAENIANYSLNNSATITSATLSANAKSIILKTSKLNEVEYSLTVKNVKDIAVAPNTMDQVVAKFTHKNPFASIVAYYSLDSVDKDSVLTDYSANANNGVLKNGVKISEGINGNGFLFDGVDDYVQFTTSSSFDMTGISSVTVSAWVKLDYLPTEMSQSYGPIFDSQDDNYVLYVDKGNKELRFKATTSGGAARPGIPQADLVTGQWIHVVGVYDGANASVYMNAVKKGTLPLTGTIKTGQVAMLGKSGTTGTISYLKGSIDNVQVFNTALSEADILSLYNGIKNVVATDPTGIEENGKDGLQYEFRLMQNYPNPFNPTTVIKYQVGEAAKVKLTVYDILGREVQTLVNEEKNAGNYEVKFDGKHISSGVYFYKLQAGNYTNTKKFILMK